MISRPSSLHRKCRCQSCVRRIEQRTRGVSTDGPRSLVGLVAIAGRAGPREFRRANRPPHANAEEHARRRTGAGEHPGVGSTRNAGRRVPEPGAHAHAEWLYAPCTSPSQPISFITACSGLPRRRANSASAWTRYTFTRSARCANSRYSACSCSVNGLLALGNQRPQPSIVRRAQAAPCRTDQHRSSAASCCQSAKRNAKSSNSSGDNWPTASRRVSTDE